MGLLVLSAWPHLVLSSLPLCHKHQTQLVGISRTGSVPPVTTPQRMTLDAPKPSTMFYLHTEYSTPAGYSIEEDTWG